MYMYVWQWNYKASTVHITLLEFQLLEKYDVFLQAAKEYVTSLFTSPGGLLGRRLTPFSIAWIDYSSLMECSSIVSNPQTFCQNESLAKARTWTARSGVQHANH